MMNEFMKTAAAAGLAVVLLAGASQAASISFPACDTLTPDATIKLVANDGCVGIDGIGSSNPSLSDFEGMFGVTGWMEVAKADVVGNNSINLDLNGFTFRSTDGNLTGTWSVAQSLLDTYGKLAIVMKDGNQDPIPTLAYLVSTANGTWSTPWVNRQGRPNPSLSNVRLIVADPSVVPLPAAGWLLLAGFGSLAAMRRRKTA